MYKVTISQNGMIFFCVKYMKNKNVKLLSGSRGPHGPDLPPPTGENSSFQFRSGQKKHIR